MDPAESPASDTLWTTDEVADFLRVSIKTVFNLRKTGLPYLQLGGAVPSSRGKYALTCSRIVISPRIACVKTPGYAPSRHDPAPLSATRRVFR